MSGEKHDPVREVIFDLTWHIREWWGKQTEEQQSALYDYLGGSFYLFRCIEAEAERFETMWLALPEEQKETYYETVDDWADSVIVGWLNAMGGGNNDGDSRNSGRNSL